MQSTKLPNAIDVEVGAKIKFRRRLLGLSQGKLAKGLGVTFQQVQKYESGTNRVGASRILALANILQVGPDFFFAQSADDRASVSSPSTLETDAITSFLSTREGLEINRAFMMIKSHKARRSIVALAVALAQNRAARDQDLPIGVNETTEPTL